MKILKILLVVIFVMGIASIAQAITWEDAINYISSNVKQAEAFYDFDHREIGQAVGLVVPGMQDVFIENLDISANWDLDKSLIGQLDYTFKEGDTFNPYASLGIRADRIEQIIDRDFAVETSIIAAIGIKF